MSLIDQLRDTSSSDLLDSSSNELLDSTRRSSASAFIVSSTLTTSSQDAFLEGSTQGVDSSSPAFLQGSDTDGDSQSAFLAGGIETSSSTGGYVCGTTGITGATPVFLRGRDTTSGSQSVYLAGSQDISGACAVFLGGVAGALDSQLAYLVGALPSAKSLQEAFTEAAEKETYVRELWVTVELTRAWPWTRTRAFTYGTYRSQSLPAFIDVVGYSKSSTRAWTASAFKRTRAHAFTDVIGYSKGSTSAYIFGVERTEVPVFTRGLGSNTWTLPVYIEGVARTSTPAYIGESWPHIPAFLSGVDYWIGSISAYLECAGYVVESIPAYMLGGTDNTDSIPAFCSGTGDALSRTNAFITGVARDSTAAYLNGTYNEVDYIVLESSDGTISGRYRVMAMDYGDGTIQSGAQINKTVGGGIDVHTGKTYEIWEPVIKVRHTEPEDGYGTIDDLETLYEYVSLDAPPTRVITFYDHNQVRREVMFLEDFSKVLRLLQVEGTTAWYYVRLIMLKVPE